MRRFFGLVLLVVCLTSCSSPRQVVDPVTSGFCCRITTQWNGVALNALLDRTDPSRTVITVLQPPELEGMELVVCDGVIRMQYLGLSFDIPSSYESGAMILVDLAKALDFVRSDQSGGDVRFIFDSESGLPLSFADGTTTIYFTDWEIGS